MPGGAAVWPAYATPSGAGSTRLAARIEHHINLLLKLDVRLQGRGVRSIRCGRFPSPVREVFVL